MTITLHKGDLPANVKFKGSVAVDTETMGLNPFRDRLCLVQLSAGDGTAHLVQLARGKYNAPNLKKLMADQKIVKIFHYARFDVAALKAYMDVDCTPVYCTKTASRLCRTFTDRHGLKDLCKDLLGIDLKKQQQSSDWGAAKLTDDQKEYAACDVLYLHQLKDRLDSMIEREGRTDLLSKINAFLPTRAQLDLAGWADKDIFAHDS